MNLILLDYVYDVYTRLFTTYTEIVLMSTSMIIPMPISESHRTILCIFVVLGLVISSPSLLGQKTKSASSCVTITNTSDVAHCIGSVRPTAPVPNLDPTHTYTLPELIDIAETASPEGRIA